MPKTHSTGLSPQQRAVLLATADLLGAKRWPPSLVEIGGVAGFSKDGARRRVVQLEGFGLVIREGAGYRTIQLTEAGKKLVKQLRKGK